MNSGASVDELADDSSVASAWSAGAAVVSAAAASDDDDESAFSDAAVLSDDVAVSSPDSAFSLDELAFESSGAAAASTSEFSFPSLASASFELPFAVAVSSVSAFSLAFSAVSFASVACAVLLLSLSADGSSTSEAGWLGSFASVTASPSFALSSPLDAFELSPASVDEASSPSFFCSIASVVAAAVSSASWANEMATHWKNYIWKFTNN